MKRNAFTLIELMIAVVVIAILMSIVFRLSGIGSDTQKRNVTASRLQRLENCLSGYYAAFGTYPQVPLQRNSRDFRLRVDKYGRQTEDNESRLSWPSVEAACRAQPIGTRFPFRSSQDMDKFITDLGNQLLKKAEAARSNDKLKELGFDREELRKNFRPIDGDNIGKIINSEEPVFEFGVLSFLLPRYFFMLGCYSELLTDCLQWSDNNALPADPENGAGMSNWNKVRDWGFDNDGKAKENSNNSWKYAMIPSQAVCARWMPNLEGCCRVITGQKFFGVDISDGAPSPLNPDNPGVADMIRYPDPINSPGEDGYILNSITILDGWGREFYYYSAPPYQSYTLWSAGENGRTFCPWVPLDTLEAEERKTAGVWMADDIIQMSH